MSPEPPEGHQPRPNTIVDHLHSHARQRSCRHRAGVCSAEPAVSASSALYSARHPQVASPKGRFFSGCSQMLCPWSPILLPLLCLQSRRTVHSAPARASTGCPVTCSPPAGPFAYGDNPRYRTSIAFTPHPSLVGHLPCLLLPCRPHDTYRQPRPIRQTCSCYPT